MGTVVALRKKATSRMQCSGCGASAEVSCNCGVPYIPATMRAAKAIAKNPNKSNRAIAAELGIAPDTVDRARRKSTARNQAVGKKRVGRDGKVRKLPKRPEPMIGDPIKEINTFHRELVGFLTDFSDRFTAWHESDPMISKDGKATLIQAFYLCSDGFAKLAQKLDGR